MKRIILAILLGIGLSAQAFTFFGGDVPAGAGKLQFGAEVGLTNGTPATVLSITNNDGILWGFAMRWVSGGTGAGETLVKVNRITVDGGSPDIYNGNLAVYSASATYGDNHLRQPFSFAPVRFTSSITVTFIESNSSNDAKTYLTPIWSKY